MRVVSLVPSWTETLLECGVDVVGRTRFCIHPETLVTAIPAVGGTKDWDLPKVRNLRPDLIILDREENPLQMSLDAPAHVLDTHVTSVASVAFELRRLAQALASNRDASEKLMQLAQRWDAVIARVPEALVQKQSGGEFPGVIRWLTSPPEKLSEKTTFVYVIWKKPWMAAGPGTFIASVLEKIGVSQTQLFPFKKGASNYPEFEVSEIERNAVFLFSTEPYPFEKFEGELSSLGVSAALINGESFSWFGSRALRFLEGV